MTYVAWIEDASGDAVDVLTYCQAHAPDLNDAWPCWDGAASCVICGVVLRVGSER